MDKKSKAKNNIHVVNLSNYVKPEIKEESGKEWVLNGKNNSFFDYVIDRRNGSPTNKAIIDAYIQFLFGQGIAENGKREVYDDLVEIFSKKDQRKALNDLYEFGQYDLQILRAKGTSGKIAKILHIPTNKLGMQKMDDKGDISGVWYSDDWNDVSRNEPIFIPKFAVTPDGTKLAHARSVLSVRPYSAGKDYFSDPSYLAGLQYADLEEEISNFFINHIKNGLSFGYIINFNNGDVLEDEEKAEIHRKIEDKLTGTTNAGKFIISFNAGKEAEVTIVPLEVNDAHNQWEFLVGEARQQLITAHGVYPNLFGIATANGLSNNADELDVQSKMLQDLQVKPRQDLFIDELAPVIEINGLETDLYFIPLRDTYKTTEGEIQVPQRDVVDETVDQADEEEMQMSSDEDAIDMNVDEFIGLGEEVSKDEWDLVEARPCDALTLSERELNTVFRFASIPKSDARKTSEQDTSLFKIRYQYAGSGTGEREFCKKVIQANKLYRAEDLDRNSTVNRDFAPSGSNSYNVFLYKGGVNCKHWWKRVIFLRKNNKKLSVNQARKLILELEPEDRNDARWEQNPEEVAQVASPSNNYWSLDPFYRKQ